MKKFIYGGRFSIIMTYNFETVEELMEWYSTTMEGISKLVATDIGVAALRDDTRDIQVRVTEAIQTLNLMLVAAYKNLEGVVDPAAGRLDPENVMGKYSVKPRIHTRTD